MRLDRKLNLVIPVTRHDDSKIFVHSTPISSDVFDAYFLPIAKTFSAIYSEGLGVVAGPRIADKMLKKVSTDLGIWEDVQRGFVGEMHRLTNVLVPATKGWEMFPLDDAISRKIIDSDDASEIEGALCFFSIASAMHRKKDLHGILDGAMRLWGAQLNSLGCMEYTNSLGKLTEAESSGATAAA